MKEAFIFCFQRGKTSNQSMKYSSFEHFMKFPPSWFGIHKLSTRAYKTSGSFVPNLLSRSRDCPLPQGKEGRKSIYCAVQIFIMGNITLQTHKKDILRDLFSSKLLLPTHQESKYWLRIKDLFFFTFVRRNDCPEIRHILNTQTQKARLGIFVLFPVCTGRSYPPFWSST